MKWVKSYMRYNVIRKDKRECDESRKKSYRWIYGEIQALKNKSPKYSFTSPYIAANYLLLFIKPTTSIYKNQRRYISCGKI